MVITFPIFLARNTFCLYSNPEYIYCRELNALHNATNKNGIEEVVPEIIGHKGKRFLS